MRARTGRAPRGYEPDRFAAVLEEVLAAVPLSDRERFVSTVLGAQPELDPALWGRGPYRARRRSAAVENLRSEFTARRSVLGECLTSSEAAELLGVSERTVVRRLKSGALVGLREGRGWRLPAWQFRADVGVLPWLVALQQVFPGGPVALSSWVSTPSVDLNGTTPLAQLAGHQVERVLRVASCLDAAAR